MRSYGSIESRKVIPRLSNRSSLIRTVQLSLGAVVAAAVVITLVAISKTPSEQYVMMMESEVDSFNHRLSNRIDLAQVMFLYSLGSNLF